MHNITLPKYFLFVDHYDKKSLDNNVTNLGIIYRNYSKFQNKNDISKIQFYCRKKRIKFYISNDFKSAIKFGADGIYIPAFNKKLIISKLNLKKKFQIIGSAHTQTEIKTKIKQGCQIIFLSSVFKTNKKKYWLGICRFNLLALNNKIKFVALGGINKKNVKSLKMLNIHGMAGINYFKKKPAQLGRFL